MQEEYDACDAVPIRDVDRACGVGNNCSNKPGTVLHKNVTIQFWEE